MSSKNDWDEFANTGDFISAKSMVFLAMEHSRRWPCLKSEASKVR